MTAQQIDVWAVLYRGKLLGLFTDEASAAAHKKEYNAIVEDDYTVRQFLLVPVSASSAASADAQTALFPANVRTNDDMPVAAWEKREEIWKSPDLFTTKQLVIEFAEILRAEANARIAALHQQLAFKQGDYSRMADSYAEAQDTIYAALNALEQVEEADLVEVATATMQQLKDAKEDAQLWKGAYRGAQNAVVASRTRYHQMFDLYGAADGKDPMSRLASLGEAYMNARDAILKACKIIEMGDQRLLASDGPAGGQPPDLSLEEWSTLYETLRAVRGMPHPPTKDKDKTP